MKFILFIIFLMKISVLYANDHCYAMLQIRIPEKNCHAFDGCAPNLEDDILVTNYQPRVPYHQNFLQMVQQCQDFCSWRGSECKGYITGNYIELVEARDPEQLLKKLMPSYSKENDHIEKPLQNVDCICVGANNISDDTDRAYSELKAKFVATESLFTMLSGIVTFWGGLYGCLSNVNPG